MRWVGFAALVCAARIASADDVGVVTAGDKELHPKVERHLERWLDKQGTQTIDSPLSASALNTLADCFVIDDLKCARGVFEARSKADRLAYVHVEVAGDDIKFQMYWFVKGHDALAERSVCAKCTDAAWHTLVDGTVKRWLADPTRVPVITKDEAPHTERRTPWFARGLLATGIASMITGGVFVYLGERDGREHKWLYDDATTVGVVVLAVGTGATIGGSIWLIQSGSSRSTPVAALTPAGGYVGWALRF